MNRRRIIISSYDDRSNPWYGGGGALAIHEVAKRLAVRHPVTVISGTYPGAAPSETSDGVLYRRIGTGRFGPRVGQLVFWLLLPWYAAREIYDVWIDSFTPPFGVSLAPLFTPRPVIGLVHMLPGADMWRKYRLPFFLFERLGLKWYGRFIVLTDYVRDIIRKHNPSAVIDVIPNGVDIPDDILPAKPKSHLLFLGRIEVDQKGLDLLIEAYDRLGPDYPYPLVIAGKGTVSEEKKLHALIAAAQNKDRIRLVGRVGGVEKRVLLDGARAILVPSRFETFSITILEALAHHIPVVMFDIPQISIFAEPFVRRATLFSTADFADKIKEATELAVPDAAAYREMMRPFHWDKVASAQERSIEQSVR